MKIVVEKDLEKLRKMTAEKMTELIEKEGSKPVLLLLAGGSSFSFLDFIDTKSFADHLTISMADQRYSHEPTVNNWNQLEATNFFKNAVAAGVKTIDLSVFPGETFEAYAKRTESGIKNWLMENPSGVVLGTFGVGPDGHTEGILPFPENPEFFKKTMDGEKLAIGYDVGTKSPYPLRVTITNTFIRRYMKSGVVFLIGQEKENALRNVLKDAGEYAEVPARILREVPDLVVFTDISLN